MSIVLSKADRARLIALATASADEICGLLLGKRDRVEAVVPCVNVATQPRTRFEIDPAALIAAHRTMRDGGAQVIGHYHSHPGGRAEPSPRDAADAAPDGAIWLIVAGHDITAWRAAARGALHGRFDPVTIVVSPGCADGCGS